MSKQFQVGLVGCGFMGRMHGAVYSVLPSASLISACDINSSAAQGIAGAPRVVTEFSELLADPSIDVVDICLPTYLHAEHTIKALEAGKHVVCEKPMALSLADAEAMIAASKANGKQLMIAQCIRFWPEYRELTRLVESQELGRLLSLNLTRYGAFPSWSWEGWLGKEELAGGGALDMHIHDTDYAVSLLGVPSSIRSNGSYDERGMSHIFSTMTFGETVVQLEGGWNLPANAPFKMAFRAVFENGLANFDAGPLTIYAAGKDPYSPEFPKMAATGVGGNVSDLAGYYYELAYFYHCLDSGAPIHLASPESSRESLSVTLKEIALAKEALK